MKREKKRAVWLAVCTFCVVTMLGAMGCAPQTAQQKPDQPSGGDSSPVIEVAWSANSDCVTCHTEEGASLGDVSFPASVHQAEGSSCIDCHVDSTALSDAHANATTTEKMPKRLSKTAIEDALCLSCHDDKETLAAKTASSTSLVDSLGTAVNPHQLPAAAQHDALACSDCHKMHASDPVATTAKQSCLSCHHEDVFECGTCHEEQ